MKIFLPILFGIVIVLLGAWSNPGVKINQGATNKLNQNHKNITGNVQKGETLFDIFKKHNLDTGVLFEMKAASADVYKMGKVHPNHRYKITLSDRNQINSFDYWINDDTILEISNTGTSFSAKKNTVEYDMKILHLSGAIKDNLISSIGEGSDNIKLALQLSDIFAWDIDFTTDIRDGDVFKVVVQGLYLNGEFRKYGDILSAEFVNNSDIYRAYRYEVNGKPDYFDDKGKSLKKAFLKAPLSFRRISSYYSRGRFHPILKIYRPHHGLDYAAPTGTPVSAVGDGTVKFVGYKGQYGKLVVIRHSNGWKTYYGHLSRINSKIKRGLKVGQGQVIGYVGATGLATGPHLHYEMRVNNKPVNPRKIKISGGSFVPENLKPEWLRYKNEMDSKLASITPSVFAFDRGTKHGNL